MLRHFAKHFVRVARPLTMSTAVEPVKTDETNLINTSEENEIKASCSNNSTATNDDTQESQKLSTRRDDNLPYKKKKMAMMMVYCGKDYMGMQWNPGCRTIESDLVAALLKAGVITDEHASKMSNMSFQRAARTDKGVSAAGQVVSIKIFADVENPMEKINSFLPKTIRILSIKRTTKGFDSKNACTGRTYQYLIPTYAFSKFDVNTTVDYRISAKTLQQINNVLGHFKGTHNFHNFTSGKLPTDRSAFRYITEFNIGEPYITDNMQFAVISVAGQSFMLHQIRKMIGLTIAIVQGLTDLKCLERAWKPEKCDIPRAPGLGLLLDKCHYSFYNKKYGRTHDKLVWDDLKEEIDDFKQDHIFAEIMETEIKEKSMLSWLSTLHLHTFDSSRNEIMPAELEALNRVREAVKHSIDAVCNKEDAPAEKQTETDTQNESEDGPPAEKKMKIEVTNDDISKANS